MKNYRIGEWQLQKLENVIDMALNNNELYKWSEDEIKQYKLIIENIKLHEIEPEPPMIINQPIITI